MNKTSRFFVIGAISAITVVAIAQSTSNSTTRSGGQTGSAWGSASSSASGRGSGSHSANGSSGGMQGGGALITPNYVVMLQQNPRAASPQGDQAFWREEVAYWQQLANRGAATMAGNWREWDGGLILLNVKDDRTAQAIADNDPGVRKGILIATVRAFEVRAVGATQSGIGLPGFNGGTSGGTRSGGGGGTSSNSGGSTTNSGGSSNSGGSTSNGGGSTKSGGR